MWPNLGCIGRQDNNLAASTPPSEISARRLTAKPLARGDANQRVSILSTPFRS
jgi:hypothetical protein